MIEQFSKDILGYALIMILALIIGSGLLMACSTTNIDRINDCYMEIMNDL